MNRRDFLRGGLLAALALPFAWALGRKPDAVSVTAPARATPRVQGDMTGTLSYARITFANPLTDHAFEYHSGPGKNAVLSRVWSGGELIWERKSLEDDVPLSLFS